MLVNASNKSKSNLILKHSQKSTLLNFMYSRGEKHAFLINIKSLGKNYYIKNNIIFLRTCNL